MAASQRCNVIYMFKAGGGRKVFLEKRISGSKRNDDAIHNETAGGMFKGQGGGGGWNTFSMEPTGGKKQQNCSVFHEVVTRIKVL